MVLALRSVMALVLASVPALRSVLASAPSMLKFFGNGVCAGIGADDAGVRRLVGSELGGTAKGVFGASIGVVGAGGGVCGEWGGVPGGVPAPLIDDVGLNTP